MAREAYDTPIQPKIVDYPSPVSGASEPGDRRFQPSDAPQAIATFSPPRLAQAARSIVNDSPLHGPHHRLQRLLIGQPVFRADNDQRRFWQAAVLQKPPAVSDGHGIVGFRMKDRGVRLPRRGCPPRLPRRAQKHQRSVAAVDVHGDSAATGTADDHIGLVLIVLSLGDPDGGIEVLVGQGWIQDFVAVVLQIGRLEAARSRFEAVKELQFAANGRWGRTPDRRNPPCLDTICRTPCYSDQFGPRGGWLCRSDKRGNAPKTVKTWTFDKSLLGKHLLGRKACGHTPEEVNFGFLGYGAAGTPRNSCNLQVVWEVINSWRLLLLVHLKVMPHVGDI